MTDSADSILNRLVVSPQTIPEGKVVEHSVALASPTQTEITSPLSRQSSTRSVRLSSSRPARIPNAKKPVRRSASAAASASPAQAFLSSWTTGALSAEPVSDPKPDDEGQAIGFNNEYIVGRTINQGGFGTIKEAHTIDESGERVVRAVKIVHKAAQDASNPESDKVQQDLDHEVSVWRHLEHQHILRLRAVYETEYATYCVMDLNVGGTLFDVVRKARSTVSENGGRKGLEPNLAKSYAYQLACALRYLHEDIRVCHRDVKLENCLIDMTVPNAETEGGNLRLCDFGLADFLHSDASIDETEPEHANAPPVAEPAQPTVTSSVIGTLEYASPKGLSVNRKLFETAGDVWAFGVIVYALCTGDLPFRHPMPSKTVELILQADWDRRALTQAAAGSDAVIELVKGCLERDIDLRLTIGEALKTSWFETCRSDDGERSDLW
ncbi:hypothetical protein BAUCODRAFT_67635 [Baudoinia panamericana UAMH 10762]|uniref:Protein kinase domain-containing protein n=1 Tax=Baudoinia panamericana (strain UAMH 10762) TaxID=717646 RepID=M2NGY6_BAUPA|nr:uncharacterized protein BAUCODRAFT_67635 [Baudoinia panamericana UAMH 10762]EMC98280.1 hypothetical protein BAUCODRAFT_67635 [Baudoinia panamericana UAMH 10762]